MSGPVESPGAALPGVSVVICCHNGAARLQATLAHLQRQEADVPWEFLLIDNGSTDGTASLARELWPPNAPAPLRVIAEPELGLSFARRRGFIESRFGLVSFVDDDNWLAPDWVTIAHRVMSDHPEVGACGGHSEAVFSGAPPPWFDLVADYLAVGAQGECAGDASRNPGHLWGAGLTVRKDAWDELVRGGFASRLRDRTGGMLTAGGDYEMCYALRLAGWRLWYEPALRLKHFMPPARLEWDYFRRLARSNGLGCLELDPYLAAMRDSGWTPYQLLGRRWMGEAARSAVKLVLRYGRHYVRTLGRPTAGDVQQLRGDFQLGRLRELLRRGSEYDRSFDHLRTASWVVSDRSAPVQRIA